MQPGELLASQLCLRDFQEGLTCKSGGGHGATCEGIGSRGPGGFLQPLAGSEQELSYLEVLLNWFSAPVLPPWG